MESAEQCERLSVPRVIKAIPFQQLAAQWGAVASSAAQGTKGLEALRLLVCRERFPGGEPLLQALLASSASSAEPSSGVVYPWGTGCPPVGVFVGPEGGFTAAELETMETLRETFRFVTLGDR